MNTFEEKRSLFLEMIAFSTVDGYLHKKEFEFLEIVAKELSFDNEVFKDFFHQELPSLPIKSEFQRIQQFYRLALLMYCDGVLHKNEATAIKQIAMQMGLSPVATNRILKLMNEAPNAMIEPKVILSIFQEQHN